MLNERLRILKLLEEGKINADEAAQLLEALSTKPSGMKRAPHGLFNFFEYIPDIISSKISAHFSDNRAEQSLHFPRKNTIEFKGISGDLTIKATDQTEIIITKDGLARVREQAQTLGIKAISGDMEITTPYETNLIIKGISGDMKITDIKGTINITSVAGDIQGKNLAGSFYGELVSGDVELEYHSLGEIEIKSKNGDIVLALGNEINAELELETKKGMIDCAFDLIKEERNDHTLKGIINKKEGTIKINNEHGDISIIKISKER